MRFIDTHTHLYDQAYGSDEGRDDAVKRALEQGVTMMIVPDTCKKDRDGVIDVCSRWKDNTRPCIGLHPEEVGENWKEDVRITAEDATRLFRNGSAPDQLRIAAIGEIGMDLHYGAETEPMQEEVFRIQLDLALDLHLPVIVHSRDATGQMFRILEDYKGRGLKGVFHAFSGSIETFRQLDRYGEWLVGIGGVLTFKNASIARTVTDIPLERIVLETDSPYLTPTPYRGQRNESAYIPLIAAFLANVKNVGIEEVAAATTENATRIFSL